MDNDIQLISDGDGLAVIGKPMDVERFLTFEALQSRDLGFDRLGAVTRAGATVSQAGSEIAANSGRWVKLTKESANAVKKYGLIDSKTPGVSHAVVGQSGSIKQWIQIVKGPGPMLTNPALLAGAAGIMSQLAMQQAMNEITAYLATIDEKLDSVLRTQMNQVLARMDGVALAIGEATSVRDAVGRVSEVTWSKVQSSSATILETQGLALRQLGDLADKLEQKSKVDDLFEVSKEIEAEVQKWLAVLARCAQLHDAMAVLELDRVLDASPDELDRHRLGLKAARRDRLELVAQSTDRLLSCMIAAAATANSKVLFNPRRSPAVVESSNRVATGVCEFHGLLGIGSSGLPSEARLWIGAASDKLGKARETGGDGLETVKNFADETRGKARSMKGRLQKLAEQRVRQRDDGEQHHGQV
jgi:hypothetical protein